MIQDIQPHQFSNEFINTLSIQENDYVFHFKGDSLLLKQSNEGLVIPKKKEFANCISEGIFLFTLNSINCFLIWDCSVSENSQFVYHEIKYFRTIAQREIEWCSVVAFQLMNWYSKNKFCGKCGNLTEHKKDERAITCPSCQITLYPNISPAIIVAIFSDDKILLARGINFRDGYYSLIAGFVDVGETIEDAVAREVKEEVGISIKNICYYKSQPWPYSSSMMIGFTAEADENQALCIDEKEIIEAGWFTRDNLPEYPNERSIAGEIINKFVKNEI